MTDEDAILQHAEIIVEAVALSQAMLDGDYQEARFRVRLIATTADIAGLSDVGRAAGRVVDLLARVSVALQPGYGQAIEALSVAINRASTLGSRTTVKVPQPWSRQPAVRGRL